MTGPFPFPRFCANAAEVYAAQLPAVDPEDLRLRSDVPQYRAAIDAYVACIDFDADAHVALASAVPMSLTSEMLADRVALFDCALRSNVEALCRVGTEIARAKRS